MSDSEQDTSQDETQDTSEQELSSDFEIADFNLPNIFLIIGKPRSGKSYLTRYLLQQFFMDKTRAKKDRLAFGRVFTGTGNNGDYDFLPAKSINDGYSVEALEQWLKFLKKKDTQIKKEKGKQAKLPQNFIVFDDLMGKLNNDNTFAHFLSRFRHFNTSIFLCNQRLVSQTSGTNIREFANYVFLFKTAGEKNKKSYFEHWFSELYKTYDEFETAFLDITKPKHQCIFWHDHDDDDGFDNAMGFKAGTCSNHNIKFY